MTIITNTHESLHIECHRAALSQHLKQWQIHFTGNIGRDENKTGRYVRDILPAKGAGKAQWLANTPFHIS